MGQGCSMPALESTQIVVAGCSKPPSLLQRVDLRCGSGQTGVEACRVNRDGGGACVAVETARV